VEPLGNSTIDEQLRFQPDSEGPQITFAGYERDLARRRLRRVHFLHGNGT